MRGGCKRARHQPARVTRLARHRREARLDIIQQRRRVHASLALARLGGRIGCVSAAVGIGAAALLMAVLVVVGGV